MPKRTRNVVVVDDDAEMGRAVARLLKAAGYRTLTFSSGEALLETNPPAPADCFILDIQMPGMSGFDLADRLQQQGSCVPIIFITGHDAPASRERARKAGALGFVLKPFESKTLLPLLPQIL